MYEAGEWIDRNNDGICQTSQDLNNDGDITGSELLPWGDDECVLYEVVLIPGNEGTFVPGTYPGLYEDNDWGWAYLTIDPSKTNRRMLESLTEQFKSIKNIKSSLNP